MDSPEQLLRPPYGAMRYPPDGWVDQSYYRFCDNVNQRQFVLDVRRWKPADVEAQLEAVRATLATSSSPIVYHPHPVFKVQGFGVEAEGGSGPPEFRMLTLASDNRVWGLRIVGPTSEQQLHELRASLTLPSLVGSEQTCYWLALDMAVEARVNWEPPRQFTYGSDASILTVCWQFGTEFSVPNLSPFIDECDVIREALESAYDVVREANKIERVLRPERLGLGPHCFVAEAVFSARVQQAAPRQDGSASCLRVSCTADLRRHPDTPLWWRDFSTITTVQAGQ